MSRRIFTLSCLLLMIMAGFASAQNSLSALSARLSGGTAVFEYAFTTSGGSTPFEGSGKAAVTGPCYRIEGNGLDIRCDGKVRYTADPAAGEMVIEASEGEALDFLSNPALLLSDLGNSFSVENYVRNSDGIESYTLSAVSEPSIESLVLVLSKGLPSGAELFMKDGSKLDFKISGFKFTDETFMWSFSSSELSKYSTVTDLR